MTANTLIELYNNRAVNRTREFAVVAEELDVPQICRLYEALIQSAPHRHARGKRYLEGRTGKPESGVYSNRDEEHLAMALFNASRGGTAFRLPDGRSVTFLDYQTPLKARQSDTGVGKIDLFGVIDGRLPCVIELKVVGGDTPLRALLEGLAYCALLEANIGEVAREAIEQHGTNVSPVRPVLIVLAPDDYWLWYIKNQRAGDWQRTVNTLSARIADDLDLEIHFLALRDATFQKGLHGTAPRLTGNCRIVSLPELVVSGHDKYP